LELKSYRKETYVWLNRKLKKRGNMVKEPDLALDAVLTDPLSDVTIYIYAGTVLGRQRQNSDLKSMSSEATRCIR